MSYLKGKNIKQKGDCLTYYFIKKIDRFIAPLIYTNEGKPEKW